MVDYIHIKHEKAEKEILDTEEQSYSWLKQYFIGWVLFARSKQRHDSFKRRLPDSAGAYAVLKQKLPGLYCPHKLWLFQEAKHLNGVCEQRVTNCLMVQHRPDVYTGSLCTAHRGCEQTSAMMDWAEPKRQACPSCCLGF